MRVYLMTSLLGAVVVCASCTQSKEEQNKAVPTTATSGPKRATIDLHDPASCATCHSTIYAEYKQSMHARSHAQRDPIFRGVRAVRVKKEGAAIAKACERCHTPDAAAKPELRAGVTCFVCHNLKTKAGAGAMLGPHDVKAGVSAAHGTGAASAVFKDGRSVCLSCHAELKSPSGIAMCTTGPEHAQMTATGAKSCVDCHMPRAKGTGTVGKNRTDHASHAFLGPHRAWYQRDSAFLATAVELQATLKPGALTLHVNNKSGHDFPTGFPGRMALLNCRGFDRAGKHAWSCKPIRLGKVYMGKNGKPTLAPYAVELASDTRLKTGATATFEEKPPSAITRVDVTLSMRLLPPPLAKKLKLAGKLEDEPRVIKKTSASIR